YPFMKAELAALLELTYNNKFARNSASLKFHVVLGVAADLLLAAVECEEDGKAFDLSANLAPAFNVIDSYASSDETPFFKFARIFILFMDSLDEKKNTSTVGKQKAAKLSSTSSNSTVAAALDGPFRLNGACKTIHKVKRPLPAQAFPHRHPQLLDVPLKRPRVCPLGRPPVVAQRAPSCRTEIPAILQRPNFHRATWRPTPIPASEPAKIDEGNKAERLETLSPSTSSNNSQNKRDIKDEDIKEEPGDYDYDSLPTQGSTAHQAIPTESEVEVKDELIKEEPIEDPISDTIQINNLSTSNRRVGGVKIITSSSSRHHMNCSSPSTSTSAPKPQFCPICDASVGFKLEQHIKLNHRGNWIDFVLKCPEEHCDFRSSDSAAIKSHFETVHTSQYKRKESMNFNFLKGSRCPYCSVIIASLSMFIRHMERAHKRMCTYEAKILMCARCEHSVANTHEMIDHWIKKHAWSFGGVKFNHFAAERALEADQEKISARDKSW
ncbi:hypothetical protein PENTCL1PPCAC_29787, partial [Pristionchus entomophagus]